MSYIKALKSVKDFQFQHRRPREATKFGIQNERQFLEHTASLPFAEELKVKFPNIFVQADLAERNEAFQLYTENTCKEFHGLLLELLDRLICLLQCVGDSTVRGSTSRKEDGKQADDTLWTVLLLGVMLYELTEGIALKTHLRSISPVLSEQHRINTHTLILTPKEKQAPAAKESAAIQLLPVGITIARESHEDKTMWESYMKWLKAIVAEFDAANIVASYVAGQQLSHRNFFFHIIVSPPVDKALLPWRELFANTSIFPQKRRHYTGATLEQIVQFLDAGVRSNCRDSSRWAEHVRDSWAAGNLDRTIEGLQDLKSSTLPNCPEFASYILCLFKKGTIDSASEKFDISDDLDSLCGIAKFFIFLKDLDEQVFDFTGTLHPEASLASLLEHFKDSAPEVMVMYTHIRHRILIHPNS